MEIGNMGVDQTLIGSRYEEIKTNNFTVCHFARRNNGRLERFTPVELHLGLELYIRAARRQEKLFP
jgi:hypothetical protein